MGLEYYSLFLSNKVNYSRSQWPRGLRRRSAAARLLRLCVQIPLGAWMFVCCDCCVLSGRGLCDGMITRPEESYRLWCVVVCDLENLIKNEDSMSRFGLQRHKKNVNYKCLVKIILRKIFGPNRNEVNEEFVILLDTELRDY